MAKINQLTRYCRILNRLGSLQEFVSADELLSASTGIMSEDREYTVRTLQRDIKTIEEVFGVDIEFIRGKGYHIANRTFDNSLFAGLLADYQILSTMHEMPGLYEYVVPEHRIPMVGIDITTILRAIMSRRTVRFTYAKPQVEECVKDYVADPYFIKQSQGKWYLFAMVEAICAALNWAGSARSLSHPTHSKGTCPSTRQQCSAMPSAFGMTRIYR